MSVKIIKVIAFKTKDKTYYVEDIRRQLSDKFPELKGAHIFEQIRALGLWEEFRSPSAETPNSLPYTFW